MPDKSAILKEILDNHDYARNYWKPIYEQGEKDVRYLVEGPWEKKELDLRAGRVTLVLDELGQYINQICNEFRQSKRSVKVNPRGDGADDQTALMRAAMIREIEYQSRAQQAYVTAGECMVDRSFGFFKLKTDYEPGSSNRCLKVARVMNPHVIYLDPDAKEADWSDGAFGFEIERFREKAFLKKFGAKATITDFDNDYSDQQSKGWIIAGDSGKSIQVASYWKLDSKPHPIYLLENGRDYDPADYAKQGMEPPPVEKQGKSKVVTIDGSPYRVVDEHDDTDKTVTQYITNGIEILEENPSDFKEIPIIPMFGREKWVVDGGVSRRVFLSASRMARDAYKAFCYVESAKVERLAMDPKTPYEGYEGQFDTQTFAPGNDINKIPQGYAEFKAKTEATGEQILPIPRRNLTEPQVGQYEIAAESLRRSIQAAMGGSPLPTAAQRQNEKSGVALSRIEQSADQGNFHFIDNYDRAVERAGRMMDAALDVVYDTPREVGMRSEAGEYSTAKINQTDEQGNKIGFHTATGDHGVTISTGPSYQSQRDAADDFTEQLIQHPETLGPNAPKILALLVKLKNLGPIGDQIAKILDPQPSDIPPALGAQIQQGQQQIQAMAQEIQALKQGDAIKKYTVDEQEKTKRVLGLVKVDQQDAETRLDQMLGAISDKFDKLHDAHQSLMQRQHEAAMKQMDQEHQTGMAQQAREAAANQPTEAA